jgi:hypothetical protein
MVHYWERIEYDETGQAEEYDWIIGRRQSIWPEILEIQPHANCHQEHQ